jgi:sensor histidine kinase YesM
MAGRIQRLISEVYDAQVETAQHHLAALRAQINPHFLYNTLDSIRSNLNLDQHEKADGMLRDMADFFRVSLGRGKADIALAEEIRAMESYLSLHRSVYGGSIRLDAKIPSDLTEAVIPRFSLQPIIENSLIHGFSRDASSGRIRVTAHEEEHVLYVSVDDNGGGMPQEEFGRINNALAATEMRATGYGLYNVNRRIKLQFGAEFGLRVVPGEPRSAASLYSVQVELRLPLEFTDSSEVGDGSVA